MLFGDAAKQPPSCHCQLFPPMSGCNCSWFVPCQKKRRSPIQAESRAQAFYWHVETLRSVLVGCVFIPHTASPVSPPMSRCPYGVGHPGTTLDQGDEDPRSMALKRNVCLLHRVEGTPTSHSYQLLDQTGLLSPFSSCQEHVPSFLLPPCPSCHWDPTQPFPMWLCLLQDGATCAHLLPQKWQCQESSKVKACWGACARRHGVVPGTTCATVGVSPSLLCPSSCLPVALQTSPRIWWSRSDQSTALEDPERWRSSLPTMYPCWLANWQCSHLSCQHSDKEAMVSEQSILLALFVKLSAVSILSLQAAASFTWSMQ